MTADKELAALDEVVSVIDPVRDLVAKRGWWHTKESYVVPTRVALAIREKQARVWLYQYATRIEPGFNGKSGVVTTFTVYREWHNCDGYIEGDGPKGTLIYGGKWRFYRFGIETVDKDTREQYPDIPFIGEGEYVEVFDTEAEALAAAIKGLVETDEEGAQKGTTCKE